MFKFDSNNLKRFLSSSALLRSSSSTMKKPRSLYCSHVLDQPNLPPGRPSGGWEIHISPKEHKLLQVVRDTLIHFNMKTVPRVAGGWVRDKLLKQDSHDIDIALDDCSGEEFATKINEYLSFRGEETKTVGVIKANPDQSKHLATATVRIYDSDVDFVNLRSETYETHSRIPLIEIGTPEQDAYRRDFTVNSLFYNILTKEVEDLTKRGLPDLEAGLLRTPLNAKQTFSDDPLRMLRAIRFCARFGFELDLDICQSLFDKSNALQLQNKISNERVGVEVDKMLKGPMPKLALKLIVLHQLADAVFKVPLERFPDATSTRGIQPARVDWIVGLNIVDKLPNEELNSFVYLSAILFPLGLSMAFPTTTTAATPSTAATTKASTAAPKREFVVKMTCLSGLKLGTHASERVFHIISASLGLIPLLLQPQSENESDATRLAVGRLMFDVKENWRDGLTLAVAALTAAREFSKDQESYISNLHQRAQMLETCISTVWKLDLVWEKLQRDPILDGKQLMQLLNIKGPKVTVAVGLVREFAILHSHFTHDNQEERAELAKQFVLKRFV